MKKIYLFFFFILPAANISFCQDLPNPSANLQAMPAGSYVIAMDNNNQNDGGVFNLRSYGLIVHLLNNNVKLKWVIRSGKAKNEIDFSVNAARITPSTGNAANFNFSGGPFVIFAEDINGVLPLINSFNSSSGTDVRVYRTNATVPVDVRYDMSGFVPKAAVLNDGNNTGIHLGYFEACDIPVQNYSTSPNAAGLISGCYTFASEPHYDADKDGDPSAVVQNIRNFLLQGGNFLAQCHAVDSYESNVNGHFMQTSDIIGTHNCDGCRSTNNSFPNPDLAFAQIHGDYSMNIEGHTQEWVPSGNRRNSSHTIVRSTSSTNEVGAMAAKLTPANQRGGMVFYIGNHTFLNNLNEQIGVNGIRMYMNAFLTPTDPLSSLQADINTNCLTGLSGNTTVSVTVKDGFANIYPVKFNVYADITAPFGEENSGDVLIGTATKNTAGASNFDITIDPAYRQGFRYVVVTSSTGRSCVRANSKAISSCNFTLPVLLSSFIASRNRGNPAIVELKWTTETEDNNDGFEIQWNPGDNNWQKAGYVQSFAPGGNSISPLQYTLNHFNTSAAVSQYRIRQVNKDGKSTFHPVIPVAGLAQKGKTSIYPNPSGDGKINMVFNMQNTVHEISVVDISGKMIKELHNITAGSIQITNLKEGIYIMRIYTPATGEQTTEKIIVVKE